MVETAALAMQDMHAAHRSGLLYMPCLPHPLSPPFIYHAFCRASPVASGYCYSVPSSPSHERKLCLSCFSHLLSFSFSLQTFLGSTGHYHTASGDPLLYCKPAATLTRCFYMALPSGVHCSHTSPALCAAAKNHQPSAFSIPSTSHLSVQVPAAVGDVLLGIFSPLCDAFMVGSTQPGLLPAHFCARCLCCGTAWRSLATKYGAWVHSLMVC